MVNDKKITKYEEAEKDYNRGMSYKKIAEKYGVAEGTVKSWKVRHGWDSKNRLKKVCKVSVMQKLGNNSEEVKEKLLNLLKESGKMNFKNSERLERYIAIHEQFWKYTNDLKERGHIITYENGKQISTKKNESAELQLKAAATLDKIIESMGLDNIPTNKDEDDEL